MASEPSILESVIPALSRLGPDGRLAPEDTAALEKMLAAASGEQLNALCFEAGLFVVLFSAEGAAPVAAKQVVELVNKHSARLPNPTQAPGLEEAREAAKALGLDASLKPVGTGPAPAGSVRGLGARMLAHKKP